MPTPETVRFFFTDQLGAPIEGVLVRLFDSGGMFVTSNVSSLVGVDAIADVTLDGDPDPTPISYTARFSKNGISFDGSLGDVSKTPQAIDVYSPNTDSPTGTNDFDVKGETHVIPTATDSRLCRCSGFFRDITGRPLPGLDMHVVNQFRPALVDGAGILGEGVFLRTDKDGFAQIDLFRNGRYTFLVTSTEAIDDPNLQGAIAFPRMVCVPDQSSYNLVDLLFPVIAEISFAPTGPYSLSVNEVKNIVPSVVASDGRLLDNVASSDVLYSVSPSGIVSLGVGDGQLTLTALAPGSATLTAERIDKSIVTIPETVIVGVPISITVA